MLFSCTTSTFVSNYNTGLDGQPMTWVIFIFWYDYTAYNDSFFSLLKGLQIRRKI